MSWRRCSRAALVVMLAGLTLAACGGDDGAEGAGGDDDTSTGGDGSGDDGDGSGGDGGDGRSVPTAGPGEAGVFTGPTGAENPPEFPIPVCGDINAHERLQFEQYDELLAELECIFANAGRMPPGVIDAANEAAAQARAGIAGRSESSGTDTETETESPDPDSGTESPDLEGGAGSTEPANGSEPAPDDDTELEPSG